MKYLSVFWLIALVAGYSIAQSKERTGTVKGDVVDEAGVIIPDSTITFSTSDRKQFRAVSDQNGQYQLQLPAGIYAVRVEYSKHQAWDKFVATNFVIVAGEMRTFDFVLKVSREWTQTYGSPVAGNPVGLNTKNEKALLGGTVYDSQGAVVPSVDVRFSDKREKNLSLRLISLDRTILNCRPDPIPLHLVHGQAISSCSSSRSITSQRRTKEI